MKSTIFFSEYMEVYCVKERRVTPNVPGSEKTGTAKNGRTFLKVKCASCGKTKTRFVSEKPKQSGRGQFLIDWGKAWNLISNPNLFKGPEMSAKEGRALVREYKRKYKAYKDAGGSRSYGSWLKWKGYSESSY